MKNRVLALLLCLVMMLGFIPGGIMNSAKVEAAQADTVPTSLKIDFKDFATKASKQAFWSKLGVGSNDMTKYAGSPVYNKAMTDQEQQAYKDLLAWQQEAFDWHFDEAVSKVANAGNAKVLHFNSDPNVPWGLAFRSMFHSMDRCNLVINLEVPEGGAGLYSMTMDIFRETTSYVSPIVGASPGGGYLDIYVNEELAFDEYYFGGPNTTASENLGMVELKEGTNTIRLYSTRGFTGTTSNYERCVYDMSAITFDRLTGLNVECGQKAMFNLRNSYLPYNTDMSKCSVGVVDDSVAKASLDADGNVVVQGLQEGETTLFVQQGSTVTDIPVYVTPKLSLAYDFSKASSLTADGFDAISDFDDLDVDDVMSDPWCYEEGHAYWSVENGAAVLDGGNISFTLDVTKEGWFEAALDVFAQSKGGAVKVWLDDDYLGTIQTKADKKSFTTCKLRPVELEQGTYTLTMQADSGTQLWWTVFHLKKADEPSLTISGEDVSGKEGRTISSKLTAAWNFGMADDLVGAGWELNYNKAAMEAWVDGSELKVVGKVPGEYTVEATAEIFGVQATAEIPVTIIARSPLVSAAVALPSVVQNQIARNTAHPFVYTLISEDGDTMTPNEVGISYKLDQEGIVELDEDTHTITGLKNGQVNITVTISADGVTEAVTFPITVANAGGNLLATDAHNFEADSWSSENWTWDQPWNSSTLDDAGKRFVNTDIIEEENGNHALRFRFNPDSTYNTKTAGAKLQTTNGNFVQLQPGRMYEASVRVRTKDLTPAEGTGFLLLYQSYDYPSNRTGTVLQEIYDSVSIPQQQEQWTTIKVPVRAPIDYADPFYYMSCFVIRPSFSIYHDRYGYSGDIYVDDIELREVGFDRVEMSIDQTLTNNRKTATVYAEPYTTNDQVIALDAGRFDLVEVTNSNPDVVVVESNLSLKASTSGENVPAMTVRLTGLNDEAQLSTAITIHGVTQTGVLDMTQKTLADEMLYAYYTLNDLEGVTLSVGSSAEGDLTGLTTQNIPKTEEELRAQGSVYFKSSDEAVVTVDQETGDVTAVGEGTATITAYANFGGFVKKDEVTVVVTDDTDLASVSVTYNRDYIGTNQQAAMVVSGTKASGVVADMSLYPITWSVDNEELAEIDENGRLTAKAPGTVTVTAAANVDGREVAGSYTMTIVDNTELPGETYEYVLHHGQYLVLLEGSLEEDGIALNKELTKADGIQWNSAHGLTVAPFYPGHQVALDFILPKSGWYTLHNIGTSFSWGGLVDVFLDDMYMGQSDYSSEFSSYGTGPALNTVYLEAGKHTLLMINVQSGYLWCGGFKLVAADDFGTPDPILKTKQTLLVGETTQISPDFTANNGAVFYLKPVAEHEAEGYTNYYTLLSGNEKIITVENGVITAKAPGKATVTMIAEIDHEPVFETVEITVLEGSILSAELTAERTTLKPDAEPVQLAVTAYSVTGETFDLAPDAVTFESKETSVATVDENGLVTVTGTEGSAEIVATITDGGNVVTANIWITVTAGKSEPTLYTWEEREIIRENIQKYDWAWKQKEAVVPMADFVVENLDWYYDRITHEGIKRNGRIGVQNDPEVTVCYNCKTELAAIYNHYPWEIDPINDPWKIKCPLCGARFPSNDFASFYECGLDEQGRFSKERALANGGEKYLVNELYPEKGPDYGVDDGDGWVTGRYFSNGVKEVRYFVAYYHLAQYWPLGTVGAEYSMLNAMEDLRDAYLYTGDDKYAIAGTILLDRFADVYRDFDYFKYSISRDRGKIVDYIWEGLGYQQMFATCADAFWPVMDHPDVVEYLRGRHVKKGIENPEDITPEYIRDHIDNDILLVIKWAIENGQSKGNAGMTEAAMAYTAVALDRLPESEEMIDWVFRNGAFTILNSGTGSAEWTGGSVMSTMVERVNRDGLGDEGSIAYNRMWYQNFIKIADALSGYERVEGADLWKNSKFLDMFIAMNKVTVLGNSVVTTGETGYMQAAAYYPQKDYLLQMFVNTEEDQVAHVQAAQIIYAANNHSVDGLHGDIYTKDPEHGVRAAIQAIVNEHGQWNASESDMLCGEGLALLRNGPEKLVTGSNDDQFSDYWMFFGLNGAAHGAWEALSLGIDAYGLSFTGGTGYPVVVNSGSAPREHFMRATLSHNTVTVNEKSQLNIKKNSFPMHFDDAGKVKVMDAEAAQAYRETDIYRRTIVTVELENEEYYAVDFFRVLGGSDHVYSFHVHGQSVNETAGLNLIHQPMGTYAGADVPLGIWSPNPYVGDTASNSEPYGKDTAASWMDNVYRDSAPSGNFTVDFGIKDFHGRLNTSHGLGLRFTMLSDEPLTEVAIADGHPDQNGYNPEFVKYLLVNRNNDRNNLDSLFTSVIEPYQFDYKIEGSELVSMALVEGTEKLTDECAAIKVTRKDGQVDYIVYATNNTCTYRVADLFDFRGFVGVCSYRDGKLVYAYGNDAVLVADVIEDTLPAITGEVVSFTEGIEQTYEMTIRVDQPVTESDFDGRYIYVNNDRAENGAYRIYGAKVQGDTVVLDLFTQTLARRFVDGTNMDLGYVHNIEPGQTFTIPLSNVFDAMEFFGYTTDTVVKAGTKLSITTGVAGLGVTYEAEGMPSGMKIASSNGQLTWVISKTQAGRYPITVKAVKDGEVVATMSFVIYVVSYSGSSYTPDNCVHSKVVTYTLDNGDSTTTVETVCPACGTVIKETLTEEELNKFTLAGSNMTLGNELAVNFLVKAADYKDGQYAVIDHNGEITEVELVKYNSAYYAATCKVAAKELADNLSVTIMNAEGKAVSEVYEGSARSYAMKVLGMSTMSQEMKTMVVDMLNYGAEAQTFFGYNEEDLANSLLTDSQKALATESVTCVNRQVKGTNFVGSNLSLEDKIVLNMMFKGEAANGMYAEITYTDYQGNAQTVKVEKADFGTYGPYIKIVVDEIVLADAYQLVTVTLYNADHSVYGSGADSVESYAKRTGDTLATAMMKFATSAKAYLS